MKHNQLAKELMDVVAALDGLNTPLGEKSAWIIRKLGHGVNWTGIKKNRWKTTEIAYLLKNRGTMTKKEIAKNLNRGIEAIRWKYREIDNEKKKQNNA